LCLRLIIGVASSRYTASCSALDLLVVTYAFGIFDIAGSDFVRGVELLKAVVLDIVITEVPEELKKAYCA
jgi:hypothetical protein